MKIILHAVFLIPLAISGVMLGQTSAMQRGLELFKLQKYKLALQQFQSARSQQPANALIYNLIGITETQLGQLSEANASYTKAIHLDGKLAAPHKNLGFNYLNTKEYDRAEAELKKAIASDESDPFAHYYLAIAYLNTSQEGDALGQLKFAEPLIENDPDTAYRMASACLNAGASVDASRIIDAVEQRSMFSAEQEYQLATLLNSKHMYVESVLHFRRIVQLQPASWVAKYNLSAALFYANQPAEALPVLESLVNERNQDANVLSLLGFAYESAGKLPEALDAFKNAVAAEPGNADRYLDYTRLLMDLDRYDDAVALIQKGIASSQDSYALNIRLGAVELMKGAYRNAEESFQKAIAEQPDVAVGYVALAKIYMKESNERAAVDVLSAARAKLKRDFALEYVYGLATAEVGDTTNAIDALKNAEELNPEVVEPHYQLGKIYMLMENWKEAEKELKRVIQLNPGHAQAHFQLSKVYARLGDDIKSHEMQESARQLFKAEQDSALSEQRARQISFHQK
jgi:tetratricopeptide (TPR) repeat protein